MPRAAHVLLATFATGLLTATAAAQASAPDTNELKRQLGSIGTAISDLHDIKDKIENEGHVLVPPSSVLIERAQMANLFVVLMQHGKMDLTEVEAYAETVRRTTKTYVSRVLQPQLDSLSRKRETIELELARRRRPQAEGAVGSWPVPLRDWREVRAEMSGRYYVNCRGPDSPALVQSNGTFHIQLTGDGRAVATWHDGENQWPADGQINENGTAVGHGANAFGTFKWQIMFGRLGNQLAIQDGLYFLTYTPSDPEYSCRRSALEAPVVNTPPVTQ